MLILLDQNHMLVFKAEVANECVLFDSYSLIKNFKFS